MSKSIDPRTLEALEEADASLKKGGDPTLTTLSSGVVLRHKKIPPMLLAKVDEKYIDPPIPTFYDEENGKHFPNPDHPDYIAAVEKVRSDKGTALIDLLIALGTEIVSIPEGMQTPEDEEWVNELEFLGITVPKLKIGRYLAWIKLYAAQSVEDFNTLSRNGAESLGVTEGAVAAAIASFSSEQERQPDSDNQVQA